MAITCTPQALITGATCFDCIPAGYRGAVENYLLAQIANAIAGTSTDPNTLSRLAACFECQPVSLQLAIQDYLICQVVNVSGGSTPVPPAFSPSDIVGLQLWLKADAGAFNDAGVTLATNGQTVRQWNDQSGNGNNFSQATEANKMTYSTGQQNGLPGIVSNNATYKFYTAVTTDIFNSAGGGLFTVAAVVKCGVNDGDNHRLLNQATGVVVYQNLPWKLQHDAGGFEVLLSVGDASGLTQRVTYTRAGAAAGQSKIYIGGVQNDDATAIPNFATGAVGIGINGAAWTLKASQSMGISSSCAAMRQDRL